MKGISSSSMVQAHRGIMVIGAWSSIVDFALEFYVIISTSVVLRETSSIEDVRTNNALLY